MYIYIYVYNIYIYIHTEILHRYRYDVIFCQRCWSSHGENLLFTRGQVYNQITETLHVIFTLYSEFKSNQHFSKADMTAVNGGWKDYGWFMMVNWWLIVVNWWLIMVSSGNSWWLQYVTMMVIAKYQLYLFTHGGKKNCHKPTMMGNGTDTTYKNGDDWGMIVLPTYTGNGRATFKSCHTCSILYVLGVWKRRHHHVYPQSTAKV